MRYKNIFFSKNELIKGMKNMRNYFIDNTENFITFHYPHGYLSKKAEKILSWIPRSFIIKNLSQNVFPVVTKNY